MDSGEQATGTRDEHYNLISVLYHALHGAENCETYMFDAETTGRGELAAFSGKHRRCTRRWLSRRKGIWASVVPTRGR